jgi:RHH-type proline utilization regulon transcriptional repressor/proline dehydrogenase/delta 1-pyrroline-5-carboxylate dehydrogenase
MIVDSTALAEQAVRDIVQSSFQSAGSAVPPCAACMCKGHRPRFEKMLYGAMDALSIGDPWDLSTDVGPVIDAEAKAGSTPMSPPPGPKDGRVLKQIDAPGQGTSSRRR